MFYWISLHSIDRKYNFSQIFWGGKGVWCVLCISAFNRHKKTVYHGKNKLFFYEKMMMSALYLTNMLILDFYCTSLLNLYSTGRHVTLLWQIILTLLCLLYCLLNAVCLAEKQQIPILSSLVWSGHWLNPRSTTSSQACVLLHQRRWFCIKGWIYMYLIPI